MILAINPAPRFTRIAIYQNNNLMFFKTIKHSEEDLSGFPNLYDQVEYRTNLILNEINENDLEKHLITIVMGRGGLVKPVKSGVYGINDKLISDLKTGIIGVHANNLGGLIAKLTAKQLPFAEAYIADPDVVDEMQEIAHITGHPLFSRKSVFHALNQKSVARTYANSINLKYEELNLIVVHIESGISVGVHSKGKVIDVNQAFDGNGPFSFERTGTLPVGELLRIAFSGKYTHEELIKMVTEDGGLFAHLGIRTLSDLEFKVDGGDEHAKFITQAMAYQVAKEIGAMSTVLHCNVDAIVLSGDIFHWKFFTDEVSHRICSIGTIVVYPNQNEMEALALNGLRILKGEVEVLEYN